MAMKAGTPIPGLDFFKGQDSIVSRERSEYPPWVDDLAKPMITLAQLRKKSFEDASDRERMRYLKLTRRIKIKDHNLEGGV